MKVPAQDEPDEQRTVAIAKERPSASASYFAVKIGALIRVVGNSWKHFGFRQTHFRPEGAQFQCEAAISLVKREAENERHFRLAVSTSGLLSVAENLVSSHQIRLTLDRSLSIHLSMRENSRLMIRFGSE